MGIAAAETVIAWQSHEGLRISQAAGLDVIDCAMCGFRHVVPLPDSRAESASASPLYIDEFQDRLLFKHNIEVPVIPWPRFPKRLLRVCAQLYNSTSDYEKLASALKAEL